MDSGLGIPSTSRKDFYSLSVFTLPCEIKRHLVRLLSPVGAGAAVYRSRITDTCRSVSEMLSGGISFNYADKPVEGMHEH